MAKIDWNKDRQRRLSSGGYYDETEQPMTEPNPDSFKYDWIYRRALKAWKIWEAREQRYQDRLKRNPSLKK